jgi:hypothetical protein
MIYLGNTRVSSRFLEACALLEPNKCIVDRQQLDETSTTSSTAFKSLNISL